MKQEIYEMKRDFDDKYKDSLPEDDLVSIEDMTDEEFREFMEKEFIREAQERKEELFADEDFQDYEQTDEEVDEAYRKFVNRLKEEGIYREEKSDKNTERTAEEITSEDTPSEETTSEKEPSVVIPLHRERRKLAKAAGIGIVCATSVFAASMTSEANRNYFINTFQVLTGNNMRTVAGNDQENENVNTDEYEAVANIEEKLGVEIPEFCYRPDQFTFSNYWINETCSSAWMEYQYKKNVVIFYINKENDNIASNNQSVNGVKIQQTETFSDGIKVRIEEIEEKNETPNYVAKWEKNKVLYWISGRLTKKEIEEIVKNMVY